MARSLMVILLAIVCGVSAAIGVHRMSPAPAAADLQTQTVFVAAQDIRRGAAVKEDHVKAVQWPAALVPAGTAQDRADVIGRSALAAIAQDEPFFKSRLSDSAGSGFASNTIPKGMRACTIQTAGPSASVASFVRPGDRVDVLLNLRGNTDDDTGGGSTLTLLQAVEILAIDNILDMSAATVQMWMKEGLASVTLLVTPEQALKLSLGQVNGTLSLSLRNGDDMTVEAVPPATIRTVRNSRTPLSFPAGSTSVSSDTTPQGASQQPPPLTYIRTLRGSQAGQVRVVGMTGARLQTPPGDANGADLEEDGADSP